MVGSERVNPRRTRLSPNDPGASSPPLVNPRQIPPGSGVDLPRQSDVSLGLATLEKTLELSSHRDRQPV